MNHINAKLLVALLACFMIAPFSNAQYIAKKDSIPLHFDRENEFVLIDGDTVSIILPEKNFGRYDRGLFNYMFIPKGKWAFGLTASYGSLDTENIQLLDILKDLDFKGKMYSIKPSITYFFRHNQSLGVQFNYTRGEADLGRMAIDFDDDLNFDIKDVSYYQQTYDIALSYRNYVGLNKFKRFAVFNEVNLQFGSGSSRFKRSYDGQMRDTRTYITKASLDFCPGVCVFIMDNVAFNVSFGVFGVRLRNDRQVTNGVEEGSRFSSGANFKFNIFNINFGMLVVI